MLDYEKYGNSFRQPKSMRPMGGPANNGFNGYDGDPTQPEGRPKKSAGGGMLPGGGKPKPEAGPANIHEQPVEKPTFLNLQRQGLPRPPMPSAPFVGYGPGQPAPDSGVPGGENFEAERRAAKQSGNSQGVKTWEPPSGPNTNPIPVESMSPVVQPRPQVTLPPPRYETGDVSRGMEGQLRDAWQNYQSPGAFVGSAARANLPEAYQGERFEGDAQFEDLPQAYRGNEFGGEYQMTDAPEAFQGRGVDALYEAQSGPQAYQGQQFGGRYNPTEAAAMRETGQFADPTSRVMGRTEQSVLDALDNPSAYNSDVVRNTFGLLAGEVDDDYNARDQALTASAARRGLGGVGDSTVISNDARFQNLQRRSAKEGIATNLLDKQATVFGQDRAAAIAQALGFGGQQYGQARDTYSTNRDTNQQNFGQDMTRRSFGADENARKFGLDLDAARFNEGIGQQGFENQLRSAEFGAGERGRALDSQYRRAGFNNEVGQEGFRNRLAGAEFTSGQRDRAFGAGLQKAGFNNEVGQRGFENATTRARGMNDISQQRLDNSFRRTGYNNEIGQQGYQNRFARSAAENDLNQRDFDNSRTAYNTNRDAEAQGFSQKQALLQALLGYGQQGFENQITTARENDRRDREQQELLLKLMGYA